MLQILKVNNVVASGKEQERPRNNTNEIRKDKFQTTGDIHMLKYAKGHKRLTLSLLVHHDDAEREIAYDGGTEKAMQLAPKEG